MGNNWFSIEAKGGGKQKSADVYIFDYIGGWEISAKRFIEQLKELDVEQINLHINSPGGAVFDGIAIQNVLKHHQATVTVCIDGIAASIASVIALAGDEVHIADNAYVMIHNPTSIIYGDAKDMVKEAELLEKISDGIAGDYAKKMGISVEDARELMDEETWYLGREAVDAGFADATFEGSKVAAHFDLARVSNNAPDDAVKRFARIDRNKNKKEKEKIMAKNQDATEPEVQEEETLVDTGENEDQVETMQQETDTDSAAVPVDVDAAVQAALKKERRRTAEINDIGNKFGFTASAKKFVEDGKSVEDFRAHILSKSPEDWQASLAIKNPSQQIGEQDLQDKSAGADAVEKIKARRQAQFGIGGQVNTRKEN